MTPVRKLVCTVTAGCTNVVVIKRADGTAACSKCEAKRLAKLPRRRAAMVPVLADARRKSAS